LADGPQHVQSTFPFDPPPLPAGAFCNFTYGEAATVSLNAIIFANSETDHIAFTDTHTNGTGIRLERGNARPALRRRYSEVTHVVDALAERQAGGPGQES
jgi:hypothetical protein